MRRTTESGTAQSRFLRFSDKTFAMRETDTSTQPPAQPRKKRIGVLVVAYNAESTLRSVLHRIPRPIVDKIDEIFVFDDASQDATTDVGKACQEELPDAKISVFKNPINLMYGGNQSKGYQYAMERGLDIVVLLHGDGQYAPEVMQDLLTPLENDEADMVMGSRMMVPGAALRGNMPTYKYYGNKVLTWMENKLSGAKLSEFHSGYRAYSVHALRSIPLGRMTFNWHFDTQIILHFLRRGYRVKEVPIPTYYGDEICHVNGIPYAMHCVWEAAKYFVFDRWGVSARKRKQQQQRSSSSHAALSRSPRPEEQPPADLQTRPGAAA
jgi:glycosyltransferase involved in cell wall biosynthesis